MAFCNSASAVSERSARSGDFDANPEPPPAPEPKPAFVAAPDLSAQLAANIRTVRLSHGMSQRQVAARMGTPRTYLSKCERGDVTPTLSSLARLAAALDVSIPDLVSRDDHGRERENRIGELLADEFIGGLAEYVPKLGELQMRQVLAEVNRLALRPAA